jgi:hypothetical protein
MGGYVGFGRGSSSGFSPPVTAFRALLFGHCFLESSARCWEPPCIRSRGFMSQRLASTSNRPSRNTLCLAIRSASQYALPRNTLCLAIRSAWDPLSEVFSQRVCDEILNWDLPPSTLYLDPPTEISGDSDVELYLFLAIDLRVVFPKLVFWILRGSLF